MIWLLVAACVLASVPAGMRWLRIAQREHYLAPSVTRFAGRWWMAGAVNPILLAAAASGVVASVFHIWWLTLLVPLAQVGPIGLSVRGTSSPLAWTPRMRRLAVTTGAVLALVYLVGGLGESFLLVALGLVGMPLIVDLALVVLAPLERRAGDRWVEQAAAKLEASGATVVAITGSFGKTTTKNYVAHLVGGSKRVIASPASFNNRMGLARAINENLVPGTEVFVAEMGTYGPGEIADLCRWIEPDIAALVAIGPVHLERFKTEERIVSAKSEILDRAGVGVICVDHPLLARLARERAETMTIIEVSAQDGTAHLDGEPVAVIPEDAFPANVATALGMGVALGVPLGEMTSRLADLPAAQHRQSVSHSEFGFTIIDDTFNSNPDGARRALRLLDQVGEGQKVVVTPGMVELGPVQDEENERFAAETAAVADHMFIVGRTNRRALERGSGSGRASVTVVGSREEAVAWARAHLGPGDAVLYENDLPDHYP